MCTALLGSFLCQHPDLLGQEVGDVHSFVRFILVSAS